MKAAPVRYVRPKSLDEAVALLEKFGMDARVLAGGQSLMPMLALRVASVSVLVDIGRLAGLRGVSLEGGWLRIGALTRHSEVLGDPAVAKHAPLLKQAIPHVAHPAIRNRGTFGGSLALADPAAELPACTLAMDAVMEIVGRGGSREVPAREFFKGLYSTAIGEQEILTSVRLPVSIPSDRVFFDEVSRRSGDYAMAGLAAVAKADGQVRMVYLGCGDRPVRAPKLEALMSASLSGRNSPALADWRAAAEQDLDPATDLQASRLTRLHLAAVLAERAQRSFNTYSEALQS
jgi:carbon-monoxide dehydrogenase medium subunit